MSCRQLSRSQVAWVAAIAVAVLSGCPRSSPELSLIAISPENANVPAGATQGFVANGLYSDGSTKVITDQVAWSVDNEVLAHVTSTAGVVQGLVPGSTVVRARLAQVTGSRAITIVPASLSLVEVYPSRPVAPLGVQVQVQALAVNTDQTVENVTDQALWTSADPGIFEVVGGRLLPHAPGTALLSVSYQGALTKVPVQVTSASVQRLDLDPWGATLPVGLSMPFHATATLSDHTTLDATGLADWTSSAPTVAFANDLGADKGVVVARSPGSSTIGAQLGSVVGTSALTVSPATLTMLQVSPPTASVALGTTTDFVATGTYSDGSTRDVTAQATWSVSPGDVGRIDAQVPGRVLGATVGSGTVTATLGTATASAALAVTPATLSSLSLTPSAPTLAVGTRIMMTATGLFSDGTRQDLTAQALWASAGLDIATVSNVSGVRGQVQGVGLGTTQITAQYGQQTAQVTVTVTAAVLTSLQLTPSMPSLPLGASTALAATGLFSDGTSQDLTAQAGWSSSAPAVASVSNLGTRGVVQSAGQGVATITATVLGQSASTQVTVTGAVLVSLSLTPSSATLAHGTKGAFVAIGVYSDHSAVPVTTGVTWSTTDSSIATVSNLSGTQGQVTAVGVGTADLRAQLGVIAAVAHLTVTPASLASIEVSPVTATVPAGVTRAFTAIGTYTDATTQDLTGQVTWSSSNAAVAAASNASGSAGLVRALHAGTATITASLAGQTGSAALTVSPAVLGSLALSPGSLSLPRGTSGTLTALGTYSDGTTADVTTQVTWTSAATAIATVSNANGSQGQVQAVGVGATIVTAQSGSITITATVTVTPALLTGLNLTPVLSTLPLGASASFIATGSYSDGTTQDLTPQATWTSSDPVTVSVSTAAGSKGTARALQQGVATLSAASGGKSASMTLTVTAASLASIAITPSAPVLASLTSVRLQATGTWSDGAVRDVTGQVTWSSSSPAVATVSNALGQQGRVSGQSQGSATITATLGPIIGSTTVTVTTATLVGIDLTPLAPSAPAGLGAQLTAAGRFSDGTTQDLTDQVSWTSSDSTRASVSSLGLVSALVVGTPTISASLDSVTGSTTFTVTSALLTALDVTPALATIPRGLSQGFSASGTFSDGSTSDLTGLVTWTSSDATIASISNASGSNGMASGVGVGVVTITATRNGVSASARLTVTPASLVSVAVTPPSTTVPRGLTANLLATGTYTDGTTQDVTAQVTWTSSSPAIAPVSNAAGSQGLVTGASVGSATITATLGGVSAHASFTVSVAQLASVGISPSSPQVPLGLTQPLTLTGVFTDGTTQDLTALATWSSSDGSVASVSNGTGSEGLASALHQGQSTVSASYGAFTATTVFTVTQAVLQQVQVTPIAPSTPAGLTLALSATGVYSDATTQDLTTQVTWATSAAGIATVSNSTPGLVSALSPGTAIISGSLSGVTGQVTFTVTPAVLQQLQVTPANASVPRGVPQRFTATGIYSNGTTQDLSSTVTWASSNVALVSVSNASGSEGLASTIGIGTVQVSATIGSISASTPFTVTPAVLTGVTLTPASPNVPLGSVRQFTLTGNYTDGTTQNLTTQASFTSGDPSVVSVSNAVGSQGLATTIAIGSTVVSASARGFSASTTVTVTQAALASIDLTPSSGSTALGFTRQFIAIATYTDGTTQVVTTQVTWASSDPTKAFISNAAGQHGLMSTVAAGVVTISATYNGVTGSTTHTINPAVLTGLSVSPGSFSIAVAGTRQLTATGFFSDGSSQDLTTSVTWTSSASGVVQVSNASGSHGLATGIASGAATVTASSGAQSATASATVP